MLLVAKDAEIRGLITQQANMAAAYSENQVATAKTNEENKLLKKAVAIQDGRFKDATQQMERVVAENRYLHDENNRRETVLSQAADYVARLEGENRVMREYIETMMARNGGGQSQEQQNNNGGEDPYNQHPDFPPPDVF
jgi:ABC-type transporter Mla subunit MlaD